MLRAASVPPYAVGPALITVGALMMMNSVRIKWDQAGEALPAFATMIVMPLTYSIAYGVHPVCWPYVCAKSPSDRLTLSTMLPHMCCSCFDGGVLVPAVPGDMKAARESRPAS